MQRTDKPVFARRGKRPVLERRCVDTSFYIELEVAKLHFFCVTLYRNDCIIPHKWYFGTLKHPLSLHHKFIQPQNIANMSKIAKQLTDLVGNTPHLELSNYNAAKGLPATIIAKLEYFNPAGSVKDRIALAMINDAEAKGVLK